MRRFLIIPSSFTFRGLAEEDYVSLIWTTFAEFPGTILAMLLIDRVGRKKTLAIQAFVFSITTLMVIECNLSKVMLVVVLFAARGTTAGLFQVKHSRETKSNISDFNIRMIVFCLPFFRLCTCTPLRSTLLAFAR